MRRGLSKIRSVLSRLSASAGLAQAATVGGLVGASTAIMLGAVPIAPTVGGAIGDFWICDLSLGDATQCAPPGGVVTPDGRRLGQVPPGTVPPWAQPAYTNGVFGPPPPNDPTPHLPHFPESLPLDGKSTPMEYCTPGTQKDESDVVNGRTVVRTSTTRLCVGPQGYLNPCVSYTFTYTVGSPAEYGGGCDTTGVPPSALHCVPAGSAPPQWTCGINGDPSGRLFHCSANASNPQSGPTLRCADTRHDNEQVLPGAAPVSCSNNDATQGLPGDRGRVCVGSDGTLYTCYAPAVLRTPPARSCTSRTIDPNASGIDSCTSVLDGPAYIQQCTYTGTDPNCRLGEPCQQHRTTVQCLKDGTTGQLQHCQDTGRYRPPPICANPNIHPKPGLYGRLP